MEWSNPITSPPELAQRVLVLTGSGFTTFAKRVYRWNDGNVGVHWINDRSLPVHDVIGWTFVVGRTEVE